MGKKGPRPIKYVCCGLVNNKVISREIETATSEEAVKLFEKEFNVSPDFIHGPYHSKRAGVLDHTTAVQFSDVRFKAVYRDWVVIACILKSPKNSAYLLFDKRVDGKKAPKPTTTLIVQLDEIKEIK